MKRIASLASMLVLLAAPAFASGNNKPQNVVIPQNVQVGTSQLPAGNYKLAYTGTGANVQVTLTQGKKTVLTFPATAVETKTENTGVGLVTNGNTTNLKSIFLSNVTLQVGGATEGM
jgi:hypothetical protein